MGNPGGLDHTLDVPYVQRAIQKLLYTGHLFSIGFVANSVAGGAKNTILIDSRVQDFHILLTWAATSNMIVNAYGINSYSVGVPVEPSNNHSKFQDTISLGADVFANPTIETMVSSTPLWSQLIPGGAGAFPSGGQGGPGQEQIISNGDICLYELFNIDNQPVSQGFGMVCHETRVSSLDAGV